MRIRVLPEAERDLDVGAALYESQSPGAGGYFIRELLGDIDGRLDTKNPSGGPDT